MARTPIWSTPKMSPLTRDRRILADATVSGNGGQVVVWSNAATAFNGYISAQALGMSGNGGSVEVSSAGTLAFNGLVNTKSVNGAAGNLLLDPATITLSDTTLADGVNTSIIAADLATSNVTISAATISVVGPAHVIWTNAPNPDGSGTPGTTLTLNAATAINVTATLGNVIIQNMQQSASASYLATHQTTVNDFIQEHNAVVLQAPAITIGSNAAQLYQIAIGAEFGNTVLSGAAITIQSGSVDGASTQIGFDLAVLQGSGRAGGDFSRGNDYQLYHATNDPTDPAYYADVWVEHAHNGDIVINGGVVALTSGAEPLAATAYVSGNFVQIGHGGNLNNNVTGVLSSGDATLGSPTNTSGYAILNSNINITAATSLILTTGSNVPGMSGARAYVQIGHGVDNDVTEQQIVQGDVSGNITITSPSVEVGDPLAFSPSVNPSPVNRVAGTEVDAVQIGSGGHATYNGVALPATYDANGNPVDPVEITTGRISGVITVDSAAISVGGVETLYGPSPNNSPVFAIVRHDQIGHGATVTVNVSDNGTDPSYGAIQTNIGAIGNFETINGGYRNLIDFNNPYYQLTNASANGTTTDLSNAANSNPYVYYTIDYAVANGGAVTETLVAHSTLPGTQTLYTAGAGGMGALNTGLITYYSTNSTITSPDGKSTVSLNGLLRSFVGTLITPTSGTTSATTIAAAGTATSNYKDSTGDSPVIIPSSAYLTDKNGNPIILLPMDNAVNTGTAQAPVYNQALITAGTDYATNYRAYMPVTANTAANTVIAPSGAATYGNSVGNTVSVNNPYTTTTSPGSTTASIVSDTSAANALTGNVAANQSVITGANAVDANNTTNGIANIIYGVKVFSASSVTAESLVAPRNANAAAASDPTQKMVANPDGYNLAYAYADGLLTPRINLNATGSADIDIAAGAVLVQQIVVAGNDVINAVDQTQFAIIGDGNWVSGTAQTSVKPVASSVGVQTTTTNGATTTTTNAYSNQDTVNGINTSSRGDIVVTEGYINGEVNVIATGAVSVLTNATVGNAAGISDANLFARIGDGSVFTFATAGYGMAAGSAGAASLYPSRGADLTINSADMIGASTYVYGGGAVAVTAVGTNGNNSAYISNSLQASIGAGAAALLSTGAGGGGAADTTIGILGDTATASARGGDITFNRGSIWDGMIDANGVVVGGALSTPISSALQTGFSSGATIGNSPVDPLALADPITQPQAGGNTTTAAAAALAGATAGLTGAADHAPIANAATLPAITWTVADDVAYTQAAAFNGQTYNSIPYYTVANRAPEQLPSAISTAGTALTSVTPTVYNSDTTVASALSVILTASNVYGNQGEMNSGAAYARIGQNDIIQANSGAGGTAAGAASGGRGGDINITQRIDANNANVLGGSDSNRNLSGDFVNNGTNGSTVQDIANGERGNVIISAPVVTVISNVTSSNQGTVDWMTSNAAIGNGDDYILVAAAGGAAGVGNTSGLNSLDPAQGGAGGNVNVLLGSAETQGNIIINGGANGALAVVTETASLIEGNETAVNLNQVEANIGHTFRISASAGAGGAGSPGSFSANVRGGNGGSVYLETPAVDNRLDTAAQYAALNLTPNGNYVHLGTSDIDILASAVTLTNTNSPGNQNVDLANNVYVGIGSRDRIVGIAGAGGAGGSAPTGFNYGYQPDASGGDGGDATSVSGLVRSNININASASVTQATAFASNMSGGGYNQQANQIGQNQDVYTSSGLAGAGGNLMTSGSIGGITISGDKGGIQALNLTSAKGLDNTNAAPDTSNVTVKIIPTNADGSLNRGGVDNAVDISGTIAGATVKALGQAWTVADLAALGASNGTTYTASSKTVTSIVPTWAGGNGTATGNIAVNLNAGAVILYDKAGNPQFLWDATDKTFVLNAAFNAGANYSNVLGADLTRSGVIDVITFQGQNVANAASLVGNNATINGTQVTGATARIDVVNVNGSGQYDQIAGRNPVYTSTSTDPAYYNTTTQAGNVNGGAPYNGVLDYPMVATTTVTTPLAAGVIRNLAEPGNYSGATSVVSAIWNPVIVTNGGSTTETMVQGFGTLANGGYTLNSAVVSLISGYTGLVGSNTAGNDYYQYGYQVTSADFSRSNGGRGGDSTIATGYTLGAINIDTLALSSTIIIGANMGAQVDDRFYARIGDGGVYLADTADTAVASSWQAGKFFGAFGRADAFMAIATGDAATLAPIVTTPANGGLAGLDAVVANGGRAGDALISLGSARPVTNAGLAGATEVDELTGAITINAATVVATVALGDQQAGMGGDIAINAIGHGDQIFANANGSKLPPAPTTLALDTTELTPWRAGSAIPGAEPAGDIGGAGNADASNLITEIASGGRGGNASIVQNNIKGVITINSGSVLLTTANVDASPQTPVANDDDTLVAQIGHGSYATALAGNGAAGGNARMEGSGGAAGNALVSFGAIFDTGIDIATSGTITVTTAATDTYFNHILRSQIGHGNIGFATGGFGGSGTLVSTASLHNNPFGYGQGQNAETLVNAPAIVFAGESYASSSVALKPTLTLAHAVETTVSANAVKGVGNYLQSAFTAGSQIGGTFNGGAGGSATVSSGLINNAILLEVGGDLLITTKVGEVIGTTDLMSMDDHVLSTVGSGNYGLAVSGAGGNAAQTTNGNNTPVSMNGGNGGAATVAFGAIGQSVDRPANTAEGGTYVDSVDALLGAPIDIVFTKGGALTLTALTGDQVASTVDPQDDALRVNAAVIGASNFAYADSTYAGATAAALLTNAGGNANLLSNGVGSANGGNGGSAIVTNGAMFGAINIGVNVGTNANDPISASNAGLLGVIGADPTKAVSNSNAAAASFLPSVVMVQAVENSALDMGRADANIGDYRQAQARAGLGDAGTLFSAVGGAAGNVKDYAISEYDNFDPSTGTWYGVGPGAVAGPSTIQPYQPDWSPINQRATALGGAGGSATVNLGEIDSDLTVKASTSITVTAPETLPPADPGTAPDQIMLDARIGASDRTKAVAANGGLGGTANTAPNGAQYGTVATNVLPIGLADDASGAAIKKGLDALASQGGAGGNASVTSGAQIGAITVAAPVIAVTALQTAVALGNGVAQTAQIGNNDYNLLVLAGNGGASAAGRGGDGGAASLVQGGFGGDITVTGTTSVTVQAISNAGIADQTSAYIGDREVAGTTLLLPNLTGIVNPLYYGGGVYGGQGVDDSNGGAVTVNQMGTQQRNVATAGVTVLNDVTSDIYLLSRTLVSTTSNGTTITKATGGGTVTVDAESLLGDTSQVTAMVGHYIGLAHGGAGNGAAGGPAAPYIQENGTEVVSGKGGDLTISQGDIVSSITLDAFGAVAVETTAAAAVLSANAYVGNYEVIGSNASNASDPTGGLKGFLPVSISSGNGAGVATSLANTNTTDANGSYPTAAGTGDGGIVTVSQGAITANPNLAYAGKPDASAPYAILIQSDTGAVSVTATAAANALSATTLIGAERSMNVTSGNGGSLGGDAGPITISRGAISGDIDVVSFNGQTTTIAANGVGAGVANVLVGDREIETATAGNGGAAVDVSGLSGDLTSFYAKTQQDQPNQANVAGGTLDNARLAVRKMEQLIAAMTEAQTKAAAIGDGASANAIGAQIATAKAALAVAETAKDAAGVNNSNALPTNNNSTDATANQKENAVTAAIQTIGAQANIVALAANAVAATQVTNASTGAKGAIGLTDPGAGGSVVYAGNGVVNGRINVLATASTAVSGMNDPATGLPVALNATTGAPAQNGSVVIVANGVGAASNVQIGAARTMTNVSGDGGATVGIPGAISQTNTTTGDISVIGGNSSISSTVLGDTRVGANVAVTDTSGTANVGTPLQQAGAISSVSTIGTSAATTATANIQIVSQVANNVIGSTLEALGSVQVGSNSVSTLNVDKASAAVSTSVNSAQTTNGALHIVSKGATSVVSGAGSTTQIGHTIDENGNLLSAKAVAAGSKQTQTVNAPITFDVATNLTVNGGAGTLLVGHSSPADNAALAGVSTQTLSGDTTINVNVPVNATTTGLNAATVANIATGAAVPATLMQGVTVSKADGTANAPDGGDTYIAGAKTRIGTTYTTNAANKVQTASNNIWLSTGADLLVDSAAIGPGNYATDATRSRIVGDTTIGAAQNTPLYNADGKIAGAMTFNNAKVNSGFSNTGGQLRFFIPSRENLVTTGANTFNDSGLTTATDAVPVRPSSAKWIFAQSGGQNHENGFLPMSTTARYATTGTGNYAFYFNEYDASDFRFLVDPWNYVELHGNLRNGTSCGINGQGGSLGAFGRNGADDFYLGYRDSRAHGGPSISAFAADNSVVEFRDSEGDTAGQCDNGGDQSQTPTTSAEPGQNRPVQAQPVQAQPVQRRVSLLTEEPALQPTLSTAPATRSASGTVPVLATPASARQSLAPLQRSVRLIGAKPITIALSSGPQRIHALTFAASGFAPRVNAQ